MQAPNTVTEHQLQELHIRVQLPADVKAKTPTV
jgi:hypothetical protein